MTSICGRSGAEASPVGTGVVWGLALPISMVGASSDLIVFAWQPPTMSAAPMHKARALVALKRRRAEENKVVDRAGVSAEVIENFSPRRINEDEHREGRCG